MFLSIIDNFSSPELMVITIVFFLIVISMMMVYLIYSQNKQLTRELMLHNKKINNKDKNIEDNEDIIDLKKITKELESLPRERNIELTSYEAEQEEKAIISYDELLNASKNVSISYSDEETKDDVVVKKIDLDNTGKIELDPIKQENNSKVTLVTYEHEEAFLEALKQLQILLN